MKWGLFNRGDVGYGEKANLRVYNRLNYLDICRFVYGSINVIKPGTAMQLGMLTCLFVIWGNNQLYIMTAIIIDL